MFKFLPQSLSVLLLVVWSFSSSANPNPPIVFSDNPKEFLKGLKEYMTASKNAEMLDIYKTFEDQFNSGLFDDQDFAFIHRTSNQALEKNIPANPYFGRYLQNLLLLKEKHTADAALFSEWHEVTQELILKMEGRKLKPIKAFFDFGLTFFEKQALRYSDKGVSWYVRDGDYRFVYENGRAFVVFEKADLEGQLRKNTMRLKGAKGIYDPAKKEWHGEGGTGVWESTSPSTDKEYQLMGNYKLELDKTVYQIDSVLLSYPELLGQGPIMGTYQDKFFTGSNKAKAVSYPRFESLRTDIPIDRIGEHMKLVGGLRIHGEKIYGFGTKNEKAVFKVYDEQEVEKVRITSEVFVMKKGEKMTGQSAHCTLFFGADSLYHPSSDFKWNMADNSIELTRGDRGNDRNPYFSSLHQVNIDVNHIKWWINTNKVELGHRPVSFSRVEQKVVFESLKYFKESDYHRLQNISSTNPISVIKIFSDEQKSRQLDADALAKRFNPRFDISSINSLIYDLVAKGFINYDKDQQIVEVKDKVFHYANASQKMTSFDQLRIESLADSTNATLDLANHTITTTGVKSLTFNQRHRVALKPQAGIIRLKENRNMDFDGKLFAGFSTFHGKDFSFYYDNNHIEMDSVRYFDVFLPSGKLDQYQRPEALSIASRIEHASGVLLIDAPENKAGDENIDFFPSFKSQTKASIFYDHPQTLGACYPRDSFYFHLDPFSLNNLDRLTKDQLAFAGTMISAGIFSEFKETVRLDEEDQSLGFTTQTPAAGYSNYEGKGTYHGEISLSNRGFLGKGNIQYLGASIDSEDIVFKPKQMTSTADQFNLQEDRAGAVEVPQTLGYDVSIDWRPYVDSMYIRSKEKPFELFKAANYTLEGLQILTPGGLKGRGQFNWEQGKMNAKLMSFGAFSAKADTAELQIMTFGMDDFAFDTRNVQTDLDFDRKIGWVKANDENHITTMPYNQYLTTLDEFDWDMEAHTITFKNEGGKLGDFTSFHPDKDSLFFQGATAFYDLKTNELKIGGVPLIQASDAFIYPSDGNIEITTGGELSEFSNAKIIADTISRYHVINRATVKILGRKEYRASGFYEYHIGDRKQEIEFKEIVGTRVGKGKRSEKKTVTRATGEVGPEDQLYIDKHLLFRGTINLNAEEVNLDFSGFGKLVSPSLPKAHWFSISSKADKNNFAINYDQPKNFAGQHLENGIYLSKEHARLYPAVMAPLYFSKDRPIFVAKGEEKGLFKYDAKADEFIFGDSMRVQGKSRYGNIMRLDNRTGKTMAKGQIHLGSGLAHVQIQAAGEIQTQLKQEADGNHGPARLEMEVKAMTGIDFQIPDRLMKILITDLQASTFDARPIDYQKDHKFYEEALPGFIPDAKVLMQQIAEMKNYGLDIPGKYNKFPLLFSQLTLQWEEDFQSFINKEEMVGLASVNGVAVNRQVKAYLEFRMPSNGDDRLYIYLISPSEDWYFFGYKQGILSMVSSNAKFNEALTGMKEKDRSFKQKDGSTYEVQAVAENTAQMFVNRVKSLQTK